MGPRVEMVLQVARAGMPGKELAEAVQLGWQLGIVLLLTEAAAETLLQK